MADRPAISVALPTCNGARHLREALESVLAQEDAGYELIISDDRSDDESIAIVRESVGDRALVSINSERLGLAGNWNRCVDLSRTGWVAVFHQDDVMKPGHLARHQAIVASHPTADLGLIAGPVEMIDEDGRPISPDLIDPGGLDIESSTTDGSGAEAKILPPGALLAFLAVQNPLRCSSVTLRKAAHEAVGGFDPAYRYVLDWDFWIKVGRDWQVAWTPGSASVSMRWHLASETHRFKVGTEDLDEQIRLLDRLTPGELKGPSLRKQADNRLARAFLNRSHVALKAGDTRLARDCLDRAIRLSRSALTTMVLDPRLAVQMAFLKFAPEKARRWFTS